MGPLDKGPLYKGGVFMGELLMSNRCNELHGVKLSLKVTQNRKTDVTIGAGFRPLG